MKTQSRCWMGDGGAFGVIPSLEASSLETLLGSQQGRSIVYDGLNRVWQLRRTACLKGVAKLTSR